MATTEIVYDKGLPQRPMNLLVGNRQESKQCDFIDCTKNIIWDTRRVGYPAKLNFTLMKSVGMAFWEGDKVKLIVDGKVLFVGYIFEKEKNHSGEISVRCFDQLRYLRARQSYNFQGQSAESIVKQIADNFNLSCGALAATGYVIPSLIMDNQTCLDTIFTALEMTSQATGRSYCFYDDGGFLRLTAATAMVSPYILGDNSFASGYSYVTTINENVYNSVKLVRPNEDTGLGDAYVAKSALNIQKWGLLQDYRRVDRDLNGAEIRDMAKFMLLKANRLGRTLHLQCLGIPEIRGGQAIKVELAEMGDIAVDQYLTADSVTHTWDENGYLMDIAFSIFREGDMDYAYAMSEYPEYIDVIKKEPSAGKKGSTSKKKGSSSNKGSSSEPVSNSYRMPFHGTSRISGQFGKAGRAWKCGWHTGTDYVGISDKNIYAICRGTVTFAGYKGSYGNCVYVKHYDGYLSVYAHMSSISVKTGQSVSTSTKLGREGQSGNSYGSHLHLELHKGNYKYPPNPKINPNVYILTHK